LQTSIIVPAYKAQETIGRAVQSLVDQTMPNWQGIIVSDDGFDYQQLLASADIVDPRLTFVSTGVVGGGCHVARNVGLAAARGDLIGALDADDRFRADRLGLLAPIALREGAAADNIIIIDEATATPLYRVMGDLREMVAIGLTRMFGLTAPLVPLVRRDHALPRSDGVEYAEDVVANMVLIDRLDKLTVVPDSTYEYFIRAGSIANDTHSGEHFDRAYAHYIARLSDGDGFGISVRNRPIAAAGFAGKRALNQAFVEALQADRTLNFQRFVSGRVEPLDPAGR
jgi:succinoglycan biosynthesis protein ExoO